MNVPAIRIEALNKHYGRQAVLEDVSLAVEDGEFFGLVGVNGAGKTTLIKCLLDFARPDSGAIAIHGIPNTEPRARAGLAFLPEKFTPPYYLAGSDFLAYMSALYGVAPEPARIKALLPVLDLDAAALQKPVRQLSKGMAQKLGLLACLLSNRRLLVMDEPMSGLDPKVRARMKRYLRELRAAGRTVFFSTHLLDDVEALCERVAIMHGGRLRFVGTPEECRRQHGGADFEQAYLSCVE